MKRCNPVTLLTCAAKQCLSGFGFLLVVWADFFVACDHETLHHRAKMVGTVCPTYLMLS